MGPPPGQALQDDIACSVPYYTIKAGLAGVGVVAGIAAILAASPAVGTAVLVGGAVLTTYTMMEYFKAVRDLYDSESGRCPSVDKGPLEHLLGTFFGESGGNIGMLADIGATIASVRGAYKGVKEALGTAAEAGGNLPLDRAARVGAEAFSELRHLVAAF